MPRMIIDRRFNGPPGSANGGYAAGCLAQGRKGAVRVRLHVPPPLDTPLERRDDGDQSVMWHGETRIGSAWPGTFEGAVPRPPDLDTARAAMLEYQGHHTHAYPHCFVCGPRRPEGDGLRLFAGPVEDHSLVATLWRTPEDMSPPMVWAALDCPSFFALPVDFDRPFLLGEITAEQLTPIPVQSEVVVFGWSRGQDGRKYRAGAAIADPSGLILARAEHIWFDVASR